MASLVPFLALSPLFISSWVAEAFSPSLTATSSRTAMSSVAHSRTTAAKAAAPRCRPRADVVDGLFMIAGEAALPLPVEGEDDEEMEWVEEEFEVLTERDFYNTEWKIGTLMDDRPREANSIATTWVRLLTTEAGDNEAIWGDDSKGKWSIDVPSQFFSISKESFGGWLGKQIWAGTVDDFYYLEGTVRGWSPISPASVVGQWQAVRLGVVGGERVTVEERGDAPWFTEKQEDEEVGGGEEDVSDVEEG